MVDLVERIDALLVQEDSFYTTADYLSPEHQNKLVPNQLESSSQSNGSSSVSGINEFWRSRICEWVYELCDHLELSREIASVTLNYLDRFLVKKQVDKQIFQLAAITCVHLASKLTSEPGGKITMDTMIELSRGYFMVADMKNMELELLRYETYETICICRKTVSCCAAWEGYAWVPLGRRERALSTGIDCCFRRLVVVVDRELSCVLISQC